ncbi:MAG: hypothetical protein QM535_22665, partial [Limnohabitans sp.]|nr:hypothetical protein [Limnohabitans sp.]
MKNFLVLALFLIGINVFSQKYELGKVTIDELKEKAHPKDTAAVAAVLFKKGKVFFQYTHEKGFYTITEVVEKIKIYKKEGINYANQSLNLYDYGSSIETIEILDAFSYNLENTKIVKSKLKSDGVFEERFNKYWKRKKVLFPQVKEGSIIEFRYKITSPRYTDLRDWDFQEFIPVNYSEYVTYIPEFFVYKYHQKGVFFPKLYAETFEDNYSGNYQGMENRIGGFVPVVYTYNIKHNVNVNKFSLNDLPRLKEEKFVNSIDNYKSSMVFELSSVTMPGNMTTNYSTDWGSVVNKIYENSDFGLELDKTGYFENDILSLVQNLKKRDEKIGAIFNYVKSMINWNGHKSYLCDDGVKTAYKNKTGNVAEINLMLVAMLRFAGIDANPILVSTRDNGIAFYPSRTAYNYVIAGVEIEDDVILLDATDKFAVPSVLPTRDLNWVGRIIRKSGSSAEINLTPKTLSKEITNILYDV